MEAVVGTAMRRKPESTLTEDNPNNQGSPRPAGRPTTIVQRQGNVCMRRFRASASKIPPRA